MIIQDVDLQGFIRGDERAFEGIFCQYYKTLVSYAMRYGLEQMEAEDVVIEIFHHIWQIRKELKSPAALHTLLFTATRNRSLNIIRNLKNRERIVNECITEDGKEEVAYLMEEEMTRILDEAIHKLPGQCALVMTALLEGKNMQEIAEDLQISVNTVKTYKLRAIQILRTLLKEMPFLALLVLIRLDKK